jgi:hypothetical protein
MIISYTTGVDLLRHHIDSRSDGEFGVLMFFLGSGHDAEFLEAERASLPESLAANTQPLVSRSRGT